MYRQLTTSVNHTPVYTIVQGKCLLYLVYNLPKVNKAAPPHKQLAYYRKLRGLSKDKLAGMIGISAGEIVNYEQQFQEIYDDQAQNLARALDMDSNLLLDDYTKFVSPGYGQRMKMLHSELGLSQKKFSVLLGVARSTFLYGRLSCTGRPAKTIRICSQSNHIRRQAYDTRRTTPLFNPGAVGGK